MRTIQAADITNTVRDLCIRANCVMSDGLLDALRTAHESETWPVANATLGCMLENAAIAECEMVPICQDTGAACVFIELGQDLRHRRRIARRCGQRGRCARLHGRVPAQIDGWRPLAPHEHGRQHARAHHRRHRRWRCSQDYGRTQGSRLREHGAAQDAQARGWRRRRARVRA